MDTLALQSQGMAGADLRPSGSRQGLFLLPSTEIPAPRTGITELALPCSPPCWGISHPMEAGESRLGQQEGELLCFSIFKDRSFPLSSQDQPAWGPAQG